jgi:hypothetical protein
MNYFMLVQFLFMLTILRSIFILVEILFYYGPLMVVLLNVVPRLPYMFWDSIELLKIRYNKVTSLQNVCLLNMTHNRNLR